MSGDLINGLFELFGGILMFGNCYKIWSDKQVRGSSVYIAFFFTSWGYWNLYYYPSLNQWLSFFGGVLIVIGNTIWVSFAVYYSQKELKEDYYSLIKKLKSVLDKIIWFYKVLIGRVDFKTGKLILSLPEYLKLEEKEILGDVNMYFAGRSLGREPTREEAAEHYVLNDGAIKFAEKYILKGRKKFIFFRTKKKK